MSNKRDLIEALRWALAELRGDTRYDSESQRAACFADADSALREASKPASYKRAVKQVVEALDKVFP